MSAEVFFNIISIEIYRIFRMNRDVLLCLLCVYIILLSFDLYARTYAMFVFLCEIMARLTNPKINLYFYVYRYYTYLPIYNSIHLLLNYVHVHNK